MRKRIAVGVSLAAFAAAGVAVAADSPFNNAHPQTYDPAHTFMVSTGWINGIGCPTNQPYAPFSSANPNKASQTYTDPACPTGDPKDRQNQGLLMNKVGPDDNNAASQVQLQNLKGQTIQELGFDLRKVSGLASPNGSQCDEQAPAFDITTTDGHEYFIQCNSGTVVSGGTAGTSAFERVRWGANNTAIPAFDESNNYAAVSDIRGATIKDAYLVYYSGSDQGPTYSGMAILDNIDVNGTLVGHGDHGDAG